MRRKIFVSMFMIALVAALVGGATFAYFSDTATNTNNSFAAGTLDIGNAEWTASGDFVVTNSFPGDTKTKEFTVKNTGSLPFNFNYSVVGAGDLFGGANPSSVTATDNDADNQLAPGETAIITVTFSMPTAAGNEYQGKQGTATITVNANQI